MFIPLHKYPLTNPTKARTKVKNVTLNFVLFHAPPCQKSYLKNVAVITIAFCNSTFRPRVSVKIKHSPTSMHRKALCIQQT